MRLRNGFVHLLALLNLPHRPALATVRDDEWQGATETWSPRAETPLRGPDPLLPQTRHMVSQEALELARTLDQWEEDFRQWTDNILWTAMGTLGVTEEDMATSRDWDEVRLAARIFAMPSKAIDYSTGEFRLVGV